MVRWLSFVLVLTCLVAAPVAAAQSPRAHSHGQSYPAWAADWWTWVLSQPAATNPVLDATGEQCGVGQQAKVWFLAGSFGSDPVTRECTVEAGTAFLVPVVNLVSCAFLTDPPEQRTEEFLRGQVAVVKDEATDLSLTVDGKPARGITYEESELFFVDLPADNVFSEPAGVVGPCVDAGYYAMVPPLPVGEHTIHIQGTLGAFELDVTYLITVEPRS